jgi:hypothetical protein
MFNQKKNDHSYGSFLLRLFAEMIVVNCLNGCDTQEEKFFNLMIFLS